MPSKTLNKNKNSKSFDNIKLFLGKNKNKFSENETKSNNLDKNNSNESLKDKIQTILILIFYYEKSLNSNKKEFFNHKDYKSTFYLVNPNWINNFKIYYKYQGFLSILNNYYKQKADINYYNVDREINNIILKAKDITFNKLKLSEDLLNREKIKPPLEEKYKVKYYKLSFIIPSKIMNLIKYLFTNKEQLFQSTEIFYKNDDIYIIESNNIYVGNLNNQLSFSPKYIFLYNSIDLIGEEKTKLKSYSIEDYMKMNKCENSIIDKEQHLKNQNKEIIGKLIILNNGSILKKFKLLKKVFKKMI